MFHQERVQRECLIDCKLLNTSLSKIAHSYEDVTSENSWVKNCKMYAFALRLWRGIYRDTPTVTGALIFEASLANNKQWST